MKYPEEGALGCPVLAGNPVADRIPSPMRRSQQLLRLAWTPGLSRLLNPSLKTSLMTRWGWLQDQLHQFRMTVYYQGSCEVYRK